MRAPSYPQSWQYLVWPSVALVLAACGGGGGGGTAAVPPGDSAPATEIVATVSTDSVPEGGVAAPGLFAFHVDDLIVRDVFSVADGADVPTSDQIEQRTASLSAQGVLDLQFRLNGEGDPVRQSLRRGAMGWMADVSLFADAPAVARALMGEMLLYPETLYPVDAVRSSVRQGDWGADLDGDGRHEGFRLEFSQVYLGEVSRQLPIAAEPVLLRRFRTTVRHVLMYTGTASMPVEATSTVDEFVMPGVGVVRTERRYGGVNVDAPQAQVEVMSSGTVAGVTYSAVVMAPGGLPPP